MRKEGGTATQSRDVADAAGDLSILSSPRHVVTALVAKLKSGRLVFFRVHAQRPESKSSHTFRQEFTASVQDIVTI